MSPGWFLSIVFLPCCKRVVQYSDKFMHGIVLYSFHITILYKSIAIKNKGNNKKFNNAMHKFVGVLDKYVL